MGGRADGQGDSKRKKLIEAGYLFAKSRDQPPSDLQFINMPEPQKEADFYVHYECWDAFQLFQSCSTQWRFSPMGARTGLDYTAVICVAQFLGYDPEAFHQVRHLELGAMTALNGGDLESILYG